MKTGGKLPETISRTILKYNNMVLKLIVKLKDDNKLFIGEYNNNNKTSIVLNPNAYLSLYLNDENDKTFDKSRGFMIGQGNIGIVIRAFKNVLRNMYKQDIFINQNNKIIIYEDMAKKYSESVRIPNTTYSLLIVPSVIYDENETTYEGVTIYINKLENMLPLAIDEFENLVYTLENIDIFTYSQLLINFVLTHIGELNTKSNSFNSYQIKSIGWKNDTVKKEKTVSNYSTNKDDDMFSELNTFND